VSTKIEIFGKNLSISDEIRAYIEKKCSKLERITGRITRIEFTLTLEKSGKDTSEIKVDLDGKTFWAKESKPDLYIAIDESLDSAEKQLRKYFDKYITMKKNAEKTTKELDMAFKNEEEEKLESKITDIKRIIPKPVSIDEALEQMESMDHNFFAFRNVEDDLFSIIYKRRNGTYGLIQFEK
jgi:putative sigma-54 modulation protein